MPNNLKKLIAMMEKKSKVGLDFGKQYAAGVLSVLRPLQREVDELTLVIKKTKAELKIERNKMIELRKTEPDWSLKPAYLAADITALVIRVEVAEKIRDRLRDFKIVEG